MTEKSMELFKQANEAQQKYDYFISGLTVALFAFVGKNFTATAFGLNASTLELGALICLLISILSGFFRFEDSIVIKLNDYQQSDNIDQKSVLVKAIEQKEHSLDPVYAKLKLEAIDESNPKIEARIKKLQNRGQLWFSIRNWSLFLGFTFLGCPRVLEVIVITIISWSPQGSL